MYLLDTNIWLERLLGQEQTAIVGRLLAELPFDQMRLTDFTLHSIGVILHRLKQPSVFRQFVQDVLLDGGVVVLSLDRTAMLRLVVVMEQYQLDFDDAYQYVAAEEAEAVIVSLDRDFDRTDRGRVTPEYLLNRLHAEDDAVDTEETT